MSPIPGIIASSITGGLVTSSFESIATATATAGATTLSFTSIPSTYKHLQIRGISQSNKSSYIANPYLRFNSDTGTNYVMHSLYANGSSVATYTETGASLITLYNMSSGASATSFGVLTVDILDYASTSKNKTTRNFGGVNNNSGLAARQQLTLSSGLWISTSAITRIDITIDTSFVAGSTFALYGIKG